MNYECLSKPDALDKLIKSAKPINGNNIIFDYKNGLNQAWKWFELKEHGWLKINEGKPTYFYDQVLKKNIHFNYNDSLVVSPSGNNISHLLYPTKNVFYYTRCKILNTKNRIDGMERVNQTDYIKLYKGLTSDLVVYETDCYPYGVSCQWELRNKLGMVIQDGKNGSFDTFKENWSLVLIQNDIKKNAIKIGRDLANLIKNMS